MGREGRGVEGSGQFSIFVPWEMNERERKGKRERVGWGGGGGVEGSAQFSILAYRGR